MGSVRDVKLICACTAFSIIPLGLLGTAPADAEPVSSDNGTVVNSAKNEPDFWFDAKDGRRTFDAQGSVLVPHLVDGDRIEIDGDVVNTYNKEGKLVASLKADLPEGVKLKQDEEGIYAGSDNPRSKRCIKNKWVSFGINAATDALVCAPFGAATGGAGGIACSAAVGAGITAASC